MIPFQFHLRIPLVRRPFLQRDQAIRERDATYAAMDQAVRERDTAFAERDQAVRERDTAFAERDQAIREREAAFSERDQAKRERDTTSSVWLRHRPAAHTGGTAARSSEITAFDDDGLVTRIVDSYHASAAFYQPDDSFWVTTFGQLKASHYELLASGNIPAVAELLRYPMRSLMHYGFDETYNQDCAPPHGASHIVSEYDWLYDNLRRLAEAVGIYRLEFPERLPGHLDARPEVEHLLQLLDEAFGFQVTFPNPFEGEKGLQTSRGIASFRAIQSIYQAWRIHQILGKDKKCNILEIGAGLGRTAFFMSMFGFERYTIVDMPLTCVSQAYFLGRTLGSGAIRLFGEEPRRQIEIMPPGVFLDGNERFDLVLNVDSLTEMSSETAKKYWRRIKATKSSFLSINHEANLFTFRQIYKGETACKVTRFPYWLRRGYVDEFVQFDAL